LEKIRVLEMIDRPFLGGGQMTVLGLAKNLNREKFEVSICSAGGGVLVDEAGKYNIPHFAVTLSKRFNRRTFKKVSAILKENRIDVLHTHGGIAGFYGRWAAKKSGTPVIIHTLHGIHYLHSQNPLLIRGYIFLERYFSGFTDAVVVVSEANREVALKHRLAPSSKIILIRNGINIEIFREKGSPGKKLKDFGFELSRPVIGTVARLDHPKGVIYLLKAAKLILRAYPGAMILIVGGGPLRDQLERKARSLGIKNHVFFLGERTDVPELLSLFDVFVLPSLWEGLPYALVEAAALERPIVATDIDGVREVIQDGQTGLLVSPKQPEELAGAVCRLLGNKEQASTLGSKARELITPQYALARMVEETQDLYLRVKQAKSIRFL
jgi:glycosyltransferase involved in cell wall biosynthesis